MMLSCMHGHTPALPVLYYGAVPYSDYAVVIFHAMHRGWCILDCGLALVHDLCLGYGAHFNPVVTAAIICAGRDTEQASTRPFHRRSESHYARMDGRRHLFGVPICRWYRRGLHLHQYLQQAFNLGLTHGHTMGQQPLRDLAHLLVMFRCAQRCSARVQAGKDQFDGIAIDFVVAAGAYSGVGISMGSSIQHLPSVSTHPVPTWA